MHGMPKIVFTERVSHKIVKKKWIVKRSGFNLI